MTTTDQDNIYDARFDEAEAAVDHGTPWMYREPDAPNPLTIRVTGWDTGHTKLGEAEFMNGFDRDGKAWRVLVGSVVLAKRLIDGLVEEWDGEAGKFVVTATLGRVQVGEVVSLKYLGDREGEKYIYPTFAISRRPPTPPANGGSTTGKDDIPFGPVI